MCYYYVFKTVVTRSKILFHKSILCGHIIVWTINLKKFSVNIGFFDVYQV